MRKKVKVVPLILAAGESRALPVPKALATFGSKTALQIAVENCAGLARPVVVLGHQAAQIRPAVPGGVTAVVNRTWRSGQLSSLRAGLRRVPPDAWFMLYPVDLPLLTRGVIRRLVAGLGWRRAQHTIVVPVFRGRQGHPALFAPSMREELAGAATAREVVKRDRQRIKLVSAGTPAIWQDFATPTSYRRCLRLYQERLGRRK